MDENDRNKKRNLFILISCTLSIALLSVFIIIYMDIINPNIFGARKAYMQEDYGKAIKIYTQLLNRNSKVVEAHLGLAETYEKLGDFENVQKEFSHAAENCVNDMYKITVLNRQIRFFERNKLYDGYKEFLQYVRNEYGRHWLNKNLKLIPPLKYVPEGEVRVSLSSLVYDLTSLIDSSLSVPEFDFSKPKTSNAETAVIISTSIAAASFINNPFLTDSDDTVPSFCQKSDYYVKELKQVKKDIKQIIKSSKEINLSDITLTVSADSIDSTSDEPTGVFCYDKYVFFPAAIVDSEVLYLPDITSVTDEFNGRIKVGGTIYKLNEKFHDNIDYRDWYESEYLMSFPTYDKWAAANLTKKYCDFTLKLKEREEGRVPQYKVISFKFDKNTSSNP